jgi:maltose alpha-D-glucosyltransferase/alpha-amylase
VLDWVELPAVTEPGSTTRETGSDSTDGALLPALFFLEVAYADSPSDIYQLPIAFSTGADADDLTASHPQSVIATLTSPSGPAVLHDATTREDFRQSLLTLIEQNASLALSTNHSTIVEIDPTLSAITKGQTPTESAALREPVFVEPHEGVSQTAATDASVLGSRESATFQHEALDGPAPIVPKQDFPSASTTHPSATLPVAPAPLSAQPGEAATQPRSGGATTLSTGTQHFQTRESPSAGGPVLTKSHLEARASSAFADAYLFPQLSSRIGSAEQSNTSILYGKQLILKLFRRLQPGENPDVEIGRFLTEVARFPRIPPFLGEITMIQANGEKTTVAMLQGLVANQGDGWQWFLEQLASFFSSISALPFPPDSRAPSFLTEDGPLGEALEHAGPSLQAAALLGRRTAEMHLALATPTDAPAFAAEPITPEDLARDARRIEAQITSTLEALKAKFATLKDLTADAAALLLSRRIDLLARAHSISTLTAAGQRIRIHGDYHLGQTLRTTGAAMKQGAEPGTESSDFVLLDFEGEPARLLAERRQKQSPLKDVAGMLRSLSYAAHSGLDQYLNANPGLAHTDSDRLNAWAQLWQNSASAEFLRAYREAIAANPALLPQPQESQSLLASYLLEKALYELLYELNNRPTWLRIPLAGILAL